MLNVHLLRLKFFIFSFFIFIIIKQCALAVEDNNSAFISFIEEIKEKIGENYISKVENKKMMEGAATGILASLDPHSSYLDPKSYKEMLNSTNGEFSGIGANMVTEGNLIRVISANEDGPAAKVGIKSNDIIIKIDDENVSEMGNLSNAIEKLRGSPGTIVKVSVLRDDEIIDFKITREVIKIISVTSKLLSSKTIIYLKIQAFNSKTTNAVVGAFNNLYKNNRDIQGLIIDLRGNAGGILEQAANIADLFMEEGDIVSIRGNNEDSNLIYRADNEDISSKMPIVVIINSGTASAAEIVAGAWQDNHRALILGTKSFGKGSVQKIIPLSDGGAMKLTTALYYTPNGRSIQAEGIEPDIVVDEAVIKKVKYDNKIFESNLKDHIINKNAIEGKNLSEQEEQLGKDKNINKDKEESDISTPVEYRSVLGDEQKDFQLSRAIDTVKAMALYQKTSINKSQ